MKCCTKCSTLKPHSEFYPRKSRAKHGDGMAGQTVPQCKDCSRAGARARQSIIGLDPDEAERRRLKAKTRTPEYRQKLRAAERARAGKAYRTIECVKAEAERVTIAKAALKRMMAQIAEGKPAVSKMTPEQAKQAKAEKWRDRYHNDPEFALQQRIRSGLRRKRQGIRLDNVIRDAIARNGKSPKVQAVLGYTIAELRRHIERQFTKGMNWDAFCEGQIHIDHIRPMMSFDLSKVEGIREAWQMANLRPLWAHDNLSKGSKRILLI